jgi:hypothetical protein
MKKNKFKIFTLKKDRVENGKKFDPTPKIFFDPPPQKTWLRA